jgi:hypothetical protein
MTGRDRGGDRSDKRIGLALGILAAVLTILAAQPVAANFATAGIAPHSSQSR